VRRVLHSGAPHSVPDYSRPRENGGLGVTIRIRGAGSEVPPQSPEVPPWHSAKHQTSNQHAKDFGWECSRRHLPRPPAQHILTGTGSQVPARIPDTNATWPRQRVRHAFAHASPCRWLDASLRAMASAPGRFARGPGPLSPCDPISSARKA